MKKYLLIVALAGLAACKTKSPLTHPHPLPAAPLVGTWTWVQSNQLFTYRVPQDGYHKTLTFTGSGAVYITHDDSTNGYPSPLLFPVLLTKAVTDTFSYTFGPSPVGGGIQGTYTAIFIGNVAYQYWMSGDTLIFAAPPALPQPDQDEYLPAAVPL